MTKHLFIYNAQRKKLCDLVDRTQFAVRNDDLKTYLNQISELNFDVPIKNPKSKYIQNENLVMYDDEFYIIKTKVLKIENDGTEVYQVSCKHYSDTLAMNVVFIDETTPRNVVDLMKLALCYDNKGNPALGWKVGNVTVDRVKLRGLESSEESSFSTLLTIAEKFEGALQFNSQDMTVDLYPATASETPVLNLRFSRNMKGLEVTYDTSELCTRLYCYGGADDDGNDIDIMSVNPTGMAYIDNFDYFKKLGYSEDYINANKSFFLRTNIYRDDSFFDPKDLYEHGVKELKKWAFPIIDIKIEALSIEHIGSQDASKLKIGDCIRIIDMDYGLDFLCNVISYERLGSEPHCPKIEVTNALTYKDTISEMFKNTSTISKITTSGGSIRGNKIDNIHVSQIGDMNLYYLNAEQIDSKYANIEYLKSNYVDTETIRTKYLTADEIGATYLTAQQASLIYLTSDQAHIKYLGVEEFTAKFGQMETLITETIESNEGKFNSLDTDILNVKTELTAQSGKFSTITSDIAKLKQADIDNLNAVNGKFETVDTDILNVKKELTAQSGKFGTIESDIAKLKQADIDNLTAINGKFDTLDTLYLKSSVAELTYATIKQLESDYAKIKSLEAFTAAINDLKANKISTTEFNAQMATINEALIGKATISDLEATNGIVHSLQSDVADIDTIINRVTTSDSIHSLLINANTAVIDSGYFKTLVSNNIKVNDLLAGDISTTRFKVKSDSGLFVITDNTLQVKDKNRVRVQIGEDSSKDYSLTLWDADGNLIWDARGLKASGIKDAIIKDSMISDNAQISGKKVNISSLVTEINNGTTLITANHIQYDGKSLDVAFGTLATTVSKDSETIKSHSTQLTAQDGKISTLISDTTQVKKDITAVQGDVTTAKGSITTLQTNYSALDQTVKGLSSTVGEHTSSLSTVTTIANDAKTLANTANTNASTAKSDASTAKTNASTALSTANTAKSTADTAKTDASTAKTTANTAKSTADSAKTTAGNAQTAANNANTKIDGLELGGINLLVVKDITKGKYLNNSGSEVSDSSWFYSNYIPVKGLKNLVASGYSNLGTSPSVCYYDKDKKFVKGINNNSQSLGKLMTIDSGVEYIRFSGMIVDLPTLKIEKGTKPTNYSPAPEDVDTRITTEIKTVSDKYASLQQDVNGFKTTVSTNYSTKTELTSAKNAAATDATNKANQAKTDAINSANANTTTLLKSYSTTSAMNSAITQKANEITTAVASTYTTKAEFNALEIGGRNIATNTNKGITGWGWGMQTNSGKTITEVIENGIKCCKITKDSTSGSGWNYMSYSYINVSKYMPNKKYTISFEIKPSVDTKFTISFRNGNGTNIFTNDQTTKVAPKNVWTKLYVTLTTIATFPTMSAQVMYMTGASCAANVSYILRNLVIEEGTKPSPWTPAPEDIDASIATVDGKFKNYSTTTQMNSAITTKANEITSNVSKTYATQATVNTINGDVSALKTWRTSAEQKITDTAIVNTVRNSVNYKNDLTGKVGKTEIISCINQTAETIKIDASKIELTGKVTISMLDSTTQTKVNNGNNAMSSINTNKANWDKGKTAYDWTNTNGGNMTNLRAMILKWTNNAVSTSTYIQGGWIATNTITANKLILSDFTNLSDLNENTYSTYGFTKVADSSNSNDPWFQKSGLARNISLTDKPYLKYHCNGGEKFRIEFEMSSTVKGATASGGTDSVYKNINVGIYGKLKNGNTFYVIPKGGVSDASGTVRKISTVASLPADAVTFNVQLQIEGYPSFSGTLKVRHVRVTRMNTADLIVDGAITATQIASRTITAYKIVSKSLTANEIKAGILTASCGLFANACITNAFIADLAVTNAKLANATIENAKIKDGTIQNAKIATLDAGKINTGYLNAARIQAGSITGTHLAVNTITADKLAIANIGFAKNPNFTRWSGTFPDGMSDWSTSTSRIAKVAVNGMNVIQMTTGTSQTGLALGASSTATGFFSQGLSLDGLGYVMIEIKFRLTAGTNPTGAGLLLDFNFKNTSGTATMQRLTCNLSELGTALTVNTWYTYRKIMAIPSAVFAGQFTHLNGYLMGNFTGNGAATSKTIQFASVNIYQATYQDYLTQTWTSGTYINGASIKTGSIEANQLSTNAIKSRNYVANSTGSFLNLADGTFNSKNLKWDSAGNLTANNAKLTGTINATSGFIGEFAIKDGRITSEYSPNGERLQSFMYLTRTAIFTSLVGDSSAEFASGVVLVSRDGGNGIQYAQMQPSLIDTDGDVKAGHNLIAGNSVTAVNTITTQYGSFQTSNACLTSHWLGFYNGGKRVAWIGDNTSNDLTISKENGGNIYINGASPYLSNSLCFNRNDLSIYSRATNGTEYIQFTPINSGNNCVLGYGTYNAGIGKCRIYGCEVDLINKKGTELMWWSDGNASWTGYFAPNDYNTAMGTDTYRWWRCYVKNAESVSSDIRLKQNINPYDERYERMFMDLKPVTYEWKDRPNDKHCGLIAQWTKEAMDRNGIMENEFVCYEHNRESDTYAISYPELTSLNMHMIQKTIKTTNNHEQRIKELELENRKKDNIINELQSKLNAYINGDLVITNIKRA
ncbi:phage tail protein [[Eubacterium] hominis]|uniref:phage tail protein n=1 Tax=[Eubacterium] hominis TaxID=2764325 RepID=UPI0022DF7A15